MKLNYRLPDNNIVGTWEPTIVIGDSQAHPSPPRLVEDFVFAFAGLLYSTSTQCPVSTEAASAGVAQHPAWMLLDAQDCGDSVADRIIGGTNAGLGQFPWIARLGYRSLLLFKRV